MHLAGPGQDPLWVRALESDDPSARELLAARALDLARRTMFAEGVRGADREDLAQETVEGVLRALRKARPVHHFGAFVKARARGVLSDARRRQHLSIDVDDPDRIDPPTGVDLPDERAGSRELTAALRNCIAELSDTLRAVAHLRYQAGLGVDEIAAELGIDKGTVSVRTFRLVEKTRACLARKGFHDEL